MKKPNYLIIGAQKSGTTSLRGLLSQHPDIYIHPEELQFFWRPYGDDFKRYCTNFEAAGTEQFIGEKSPDYLFFKESAPRIAQFNPDMKLIVILRDPVLRTYSDWYQRTVGEWYRQNDRLETRTFLEMVNDFCEEPDAKGEKRLAQIQSKNTLIRGIYVDQLEYFLEFFPRENMHISISERLFANPYEGVNDIFTFLGARKLGEGDMNYSVEIHRRGTIDMISPEEYKAVHDFFVPHNKRLREFLGDPIPEWDEVAKRFMG